jgi:hypothetical protein
MMQRYLITGCFLLFVSSLFAEAPQLSFRVKNPKIVVIGSPVTNWLEFEVQVKANTQGTYFQQLQVNFWYNESALPQPGSPDMFAFLTGLSQGKTYNTANSYASNRINISVYSLHQFIPVIEQLKDFYNEIPVNWTSFVRLRCKIIDYSRVSGIFFSQAMMNVTGVQAYVDSTQYNSTIPYMTPNLYDSTQSMRDIFLGRIFSTGGWTQVESGTVNWSALVNTSIWDSICEFDPETTVLNKLRIHSTAAGLVKPGKSLSCLDTTFVQQKEGLKIESLAGGDGSFIDNGIIEYSNDGSVLTDRFITPEKVHYLSIPVQSTTTLPFKNFVLKYYSEIAHNWYPIVDPGFDSILNSTMKGYSILGSGSSMDSTVIHFSGHSNTGDLGIYLTRTWNPDPLNPGYDGWNLVGNPYPSSADWGSNSCILNNVDPTIYFFDGVNYKPYNRVNQLGNGTRYIPPMQGFFVHVTSGTSGMLSVLNSARLHKNQPFYKSDISLSDFLQLDVTGNGYSDQTIIHFDSVSTPSFDWENDAYKLFGRNDVPQIYSIIPDQNASINVLPFAGPTQTVQIGFKPGLAGNFQINTHGLQSFTNITSVFLEDLQNGWSQNLMIDSVYSFVSGIFDDPNRFLLHFNSYPSQIYNDPAGQGIQIYAYGKEVYVKKNMNDQRSGRITLYDITGRKLFNDNINSLPLTVYHPQLPQNIYVAKVDLGNNTYVKKLVIQ